MSFKFTERCRALRLPPTQKAVLMALADYCHEDGKDWHSIASLMDWTCLGKTTVIDALKGLEGAGLIRIDRRVGARSTTFLQLERIEALSVDLTATRTGATGEPVREPHPKQCAPRTGPRGGPVRLTDESGAPPAPTGAPPVRTGAAGAPEATEESVEASGKNQETRERATPLARPVDVDPQVWTDWLALRKSKRAPVTATVVQQAQREADKAGMPLQAFLEVWCVRGSMGLQADWLKPSERASKRPGGTFAGLDYSAGGQPDLDDLIAGAQRRLGITPETTKVIDV